MIDIHAIRAANPLPDVAAKLVALQPAGREWVACCPVNAGAFAAVAAPTQSGREQQMDIPELMSVAGFCARYCIGRTSFYREVVAGRLRIRKFGTATRVARVDAATWADSLPIREGDTA